MSPARNGLLFCLLMAVCAGLRGECYVMSGGGLTGPMFAPNAAIMVEGTGIFASGRADENGRIPAMRFEGSPGMAVAARYIRFNHEPDYGVLYCGVPNQPYQCSHGPVFL